LALRPKGRKAVVERVLRTPIFWIAVAVAVAAVVILVLTVGGGGSGGGVGY
jgi:hypothetical protein